MASVRPYQLGWNQFYQIHLEFYSAHRSWWFFEVSVVEAPTTHFSGQFFDDGGVTSRVF